MRTQRADQRFLNRRVKKAKIKSKGAAVLDVPHLIRSIQRLDGSPDCFGEIVSDCSHTCPWREYCLFLAEKSRTAEKDEDRVVDG